MPKSDRAERAIAQLDAIRSHPTSAHATARLRDALAAKSNLVVAKAAKIVREIRLKDHRSALVAAFDRFMVDPGKTDKGCLAKTAIAHALYELEAREEEVFVRGIRHVQPEGVWGGNADTAAELRGYCALGLVRCNARDAMCELAALLVDSEPSARLMAARAIAYSENADAGAPLLRMKILAGDQNPDVIAECFAGLMKLAPRKSIEFIGRFLDANDDDLRQAAILALGESRQPEAFEFLKQRYAGTFGAARKKSLLLAIAMTRLPQAIDFLLDVIANADELVVNEALEAMKLYRGDATVQQRIAEALQRR